VERPTTVLVDCVSVREFGNREIVRLRVAVPEVSGAHNSMAYQPRPHGWPWSAKTAADSLVQMAPQTPQSHRVAMTPLWLRPVGVPMRFQSQRRHAGPKVVATRPSRPNVGQPGANGDPRAGRDVSQPSTVTRPGSLMHACTKVPFRTQLKAELALRSIRRRNAVPGRKCPTGTYLCPACKSWHLTSKSPSQKPPWSRRSSA
jgi:hypothetical protein